MSNFSFSKNSHKRLVGVNSDLVRVASTALSITETDFAIVEGVRSLARQKKLVAQGVSKTLNSRHLSGNAIDIAPYVAGRIDWSWRAYWPVCDAMFKAAKLENVKLRWGGAWTVSDIRTFADREWPAQDAFNSYGDLRRSQGRTPFHDGPHFEIPA